MKTAKSQSRRHRQEAKRTRTSGSGGRLCRMCGEEIRGRRRNAFCSDKCRMRVRRQEKQERLAKLVANAESALGELRREVLRD